QRLPCAQSLLLDQTPQRPPRSLLVVDHRRVSLRQRHRHLLTRPRQPPIPLRLLLAHLRPSLPSAHPSLLPHRLLLHPQSPFLDLQKAPDTTQGKTRTRQGLTDLAPALSQAPAAQASPTLRRAEIAPLMSYTPLASTDTHIVVTIGVPNL